MFERRNDSSHDRNMCVFVEKMVFIHVYVYMYCRPKRSDWERRHSYFSEAAGYFS